MTSNNLLTAQNAYLTEMLRKAGLDAEAQAVAARIQAVLTEEIHHRMKNMLTMVTAVVRQSLRSAQSLTDAENAIGSRLIAMAKAHDLLLRAELHSADLGDVLRAAIEQHNSASGRIALHGETFEIVPSAVLPLSLLMNELCTNATKYGALSQDGGSVALSWTIEAKKRSLLFRWVESGGPSVVPPSRKSFGTKLVEKGIPGQFGVVGNLSFPVAGVEFELNIPLDRLKPVDPRLESPI